MTTGLLWRLSQRLRPGLSRTQSEQELQQAQLQMLPLLFTLPYTALALIWLVAATRPQAIADHAAALALALAAVLAMHRFTFTIYAQLPGGRRVPINGSLAGIAVWAGALVAGPVALWLPLIDQLLWSVSTVRRGRQMQQPVGWELASVISQDAGGNALPQLIGLAVFRAAGGAHPLAGLTTDAWGPAILAGLAAAAAQQVVMQPLLVAVERAAGAPNARRFSPMGVLLIGLALIDIPFAVLGALIVSESGRGLFGLYLAGLVLVNLLAHHLSRSSEQSQQRARELARLEALGEALIQAPPDLSTFEELLREHLGGMFPHDRFELRLSAGPDALSAGLPWPDLRLTFPPDRPPLDDAAWQRLTSANLAHVIVRDAIPPGLGAPHGDALLVPIAVDTPGKEGGAKEHLLGGIALLRHRSMGRSLHSLAALQSLAAQIGSAHYRARVHLETLTAQRMANELALAGQIQQTFLPHGVPELPGWDLSAVLRPARETSGDFYDFVPLPEGRLGVLVADVADKGTGAALYMALSRTLIRTFALHHPDAPDEVLRAANERLLSDVQSDQFVTVFYAVLNPTGTLCYASAGHNPAYVLRARPGALPEPLRRTGVPLGMFAHSRWTCASVTLQPADALLLYTDGVTEAHNPQAALFGEERLCAAAQSRAGGPAEAIQSAIVDAVHAFADSAPQADDITLLVAVRR